MSKPVARVARGFRRSLTNNLGLKVLSVVAAIALFSLVHGAEDVQQSFFVDVVSTLPPNSAGKVLVSELPDKVKVTLRGSRSVLNSVDNEEIGPVELDLRDTRRSYYYFDSEALDLPAEVDVVQLVPSSIQLKWVDRVERRLPVEPRFAGKPPDGLHARPVRVEPSTILVRGAETAVQPMRVVETQPIDVSGLERGRHRRTASTERAPLHTEFDDRAVDVVFELAPRQAERTLEDLEISAVGPRRVRMQPSRVDVTLWGTSKQLERLDRGRIIPYVQLSKLNLSGSAEEASVRVRGVPPGIDWRTMPSSVLVQPAPRGSDGSDDEG